jgi:subtilisin family serine protease
MALAVVPTSRAEGKKIKVETIDDLPRRTYEVTMKPSELVVADEEFRKLAHRIKQNALADLETFEIADPTALQRYYDTLQIIYFLEGDFKTSTEYLEKARKLEQKEAQKYAMGLVGLSYIDAIKIEKDPSSDAFKKLMRDNMRARIKQMPWDKVSDTFEALNGQMQILSENLLIGVIKGQLDPAVESTGHLSGDQASQLVMFRSALHHILPYKDDIQAVIGEAIEAHKVVKEDIWAARDIVLPENDDYSEVVVAIWDAGVDVGVFKGRLFVNPEEKSNGKDTDGNGFIDDVHGIAFDLEANPSPELLYPLGDREKDRQVLENRIKGFTDITASVDSPEAEDVRKAMGALEPDEVTDFIEGLTLYANYSHGTHVAGIAVDGNPYAKILVARIAFDHHIVPRPYTKELIRAYSESFTRTVDYFKAHGVRVVNMSWVIGLREIERNLEANGIGESAEERGEMAREMFEICEKALYAAFTGAPDILFVGGAGNSDNDVEFDLFVPPAFQLPNLVIAGAVDQAGEPTGFTSFGETVALYSNGFEVESYVPGGNRIKMSGTSMAAPNVTNLAAKLIARDPSLEPPDVIALMKKGADDMGGDELEMLVINPKRTMKLLEKKLASN